MTVKANMPTLYSQLKRLPWKGVPSFSYVTKGHGRRVRRTVRAVLAPAWTEFEGASQVAQARRTVTRKGKKTVEVVYVITSDATTDAATLAAWIQGHWHIENNLHWVRDVTYQEDKSLVRTGNAPRAMATLPVDWPSACCAWTATRTSPPPTATTPATRSGRSHYFKLHECDFAGSLPAPPTAVPITRVICINLSRRSVT
jgi:predicted transposase YbfD/YdcC